MKKRNDQNVIVKRAVLVFILMFLVLLAALAFFTRSIVMREGIEPGGSFKAFRETLRERVARKQA